MLHATDMPSHIASPSVHQATALDHLAAVAAYSDSLRDEWEKDRPDRADVQYLTAAIGRGLKLAEIHASLNIGAQLDRIVQRLDAAAATWPDVSNSDGAASFADLARGHR